MTPKQAAQEMRSRARRLKRELERAEAETVRHGKERGEILSSGGYSLKQLARMGHPYGRGVRPRQPVHQFLRGRKGLVIGPGQDPAVINRQSGQFYRGWIAVRPFWTAGVLQSLIANVTPHVKYLLYGTTRMIQRPIRERLTEKYIKPDRLARLQNAMRRALKL